MTAPFDDIPEAKRDTPLLPVRPLSTRRTPFLTWVGVGLAIAFIAGLLTSLSLPPTTAAGRTALLTAQSGFQMGLSQVGFPLVDPSLLGHLPYEEADPNALQPLASNQAVRLRRAAAEQLDRMVAAAQADGVLMLPASGFRSHEEQERLFFDLKAQRGQLVSERAEVSAPPGYSEHHTGYAIDIVDSRFPNTNLNTRFENTPAFKWLQQNAARYSFELSFPRNNPRGISYEPWHWRFVGDRHSLETFYSARRTPVNRSSNTP